MSHTDDPGAEPTSHTDDEGVVDRVARWGPTALAAVAVAVVGLRTGPAGLLAGVLGAGVLVVVRARLAPPYAVAVGQVAVVAALAGRAPGPAFWTAEAALVTVLVAPELDSPRGRRVAVVAVLSTAALVAVAVAAQATWERPWASGLALVATGALIAYGLHRFEQVQLGVVDSE